MGKLHTARAHLSQEHLSLFSRLSYDGQATLLEDFLDVFTGACFSVHHVEEVGTTLGLNRKGDVASFIWQSPIVDFVQVLLEGIDRIGDSDLVN